MLTTVEGRSRVAEAISIGARSRVSVKSPVTLTLSTRSHAFQGKVSNGSPQFAPALLTRMCKHVGALPGLRGQRGDAGFRRDRAAEALAWAQRGKLAAPPVSQASALREAISTRAPALKQRLGADPAEAGRPASHQRGAAADGKKLVCCEHGSLRRSRFARDHSNSAARAKTAALNRREGRGFGSRGQLDG